MDNFYSAKQSLTNKASAIEKSELDSWPAQVAQGTSSIA